MAVRCREDVQKKTTFSNKGPTKRHNKLLMMRYTFENDLCAGNLFALKAWAGMYRRDDKLETVLVCGSVMINWTVLSSKNDQSQPVIKETMARIGQPAGVGR